MSVCPICLPIFFLIFSRRTRIGCRIDPVMDLNIDHFHLVFWIRLDSNPQPLYRESRLLTTRLNLRPKIILSFTSPDESLNKIILSRRYWFFTLQSKAGFFKNKHIFFFWNFSFIKTWHLTKIRTWMYQYFHKWETNLNEYLIQ